MPNISSTQITMRSLSDFLSSEWLLLSRVSVFWFGPSESEKSSPYYDWLQSTCHGITRSQVVSGWWLKRHSKGTMNIDGKHGKVTRATFGITQSHSLVDVKFRSLLSLWVSFSTSSSFLIPPATPTKTSESPPEQTKFVNKKQSPAY